MGKQNLDNRESFRQNVRETQGLPRKYPRSSFTITVSWNLAAPKLGRSTELLYNKEMKSNRILTS